MVHQGGPHMVGKRRHLRTNLGTLLLAVGLSLAGEAFAAESMKGQVLGAGAPIAGSTVTLWQPLKTGTLPATVAPLSDI